MQHRFFLPIAAAALSLALLGSTVASAERRVGSEAAVERRGEPGAYGVFAQAATGDARSDVDRDADVERKPLEPTFEPREPEPKPWYNSDYLFGMTRGVANSTIAPAGKVPLFVLTVPLDIVCLPFAAIGGFFG